MGRLRDNFKPIVNRSPPLTEAQRTRRRAFGRRAALRLVAVALGCAVSLLVGWGRGIEVLVLAPFALAFVWAIRAAISWEELPAEIEEREQREAREAPQRTWIDGR